LTKALVTGGAGFIGAFLARELIRRDFAVDLVDNFARGRRDTFLDSLLETETVRLIERDLLQRDALDDLGDDYTHVFHLAAILGVQRVLETPYQTLRDNIQLLDTTIGLARRQRAIARFMFLSTSEVYAGSLEHMDMPIPTPELTPLALTDLASPRTSYMLSKMCGEALVQYSGLPFTIIRPHNFYGPRMGQAHVIPQLLEKAHFAADGDRIEVFSVDHRRTFCFIDDAIEMIVRAALSPACLGETLNAGSGAPEIEMAQLARVVIDTVGKRLTVEPKPATPGSPTRRCPDMKKMAELTGYRAQTTVEEGVRKTYDWYRPMVFEGREKAVAT
jgi:UDP-glucose 4-epimerase